MTRLDDALNEAQQRLAEISAGWDFDCVGACAHLRCRLRRCIERDIATMERHTHYCGCSDNFYCSEVAPLLDEYAKQETRCADHNDTFCDLCGNAPAEPSVPTEPPPNGWLSPAGQLRETGDEQAPRPTGPDRPSVKGSAIPRRVVCPCGETPHSAVCPLAAPSTPEATAEPWSAKCPDRCSCPGHRPASLEATPPTTEEQP